MAEKLEKETKSQFRAFEVRLYPTTEQSTLFDKTFGNCRAYYNILLHDYRDFYETTITPEPDKSKHKELWKRYHQKTPKEFRTVFEEKKPDCGLRR